MDICLKREDRVGYSFGIDVVKIFAIIFVVMTHCDGFPYGDFWMNTCVPAFIIVAAFNHSRKCYKSGYVLPKGWYCKKNLLGYLKRISLPYLFFMLVQVIVLPIVKYNTFSMVLLNTAIGGMGPGGYYLFIFAQIFLVFPILLAAYEKKPITAIAAGSVFKICVECIIAYLMPLNEFVVFGFNKLFFARMTVYLFAGISLFKNYDKICPRKIMMALLLGFALTVAKEFLGYTGVVLVDTCIETVRQTAWNAGLVATAICLFSGGGALKSRRAVSFVAGSTLHILLFQQFYFCLVGAGRGKTIIDLPVSIAGGIAIYAVWRFAEKGIRILKTKAVAKKASKV